MITVLESRILVELPEVSDKTEGGIIKSEDMIAEEVAAIESVDYQAVASFVGPGCKVVKQGDWIEIDTGSVPILTLQGKKYGAIYEHNVVCVVEQVESNAVQA